jgi:addiction module HigA family antidote
MNQPSLTAPHPGTILRQEFMNPLKITAYRLSKELGVTPITVSHILRGKRSISVSIAARLGVYFDVPSDFWLRLQAAFDLANMSKEDQFKVSHCDKLGERKFQITDHSNGSTEFQIKLVDGKTSTDSTLPRSRVKNSRSKTHILKSTTS